jgi:hypothetical protein
MVGTKMGLGKVDLQLAGKIPETVFALIVPIPTPVAGSGGVMIMTGITRANNATTDAMETHQTISGGMETAIGHMVRVHHVIAGATTGLAATECQLVSVKCVSLA